MRRYLQVFRLYGGLRPDCHAILPGHLPSPHEQSVRQGYVLQSQIHSLKCPSRSPGLNFEDPWVNNRLRKCVKTKGHRHIVLTLGSPEPDSSTTGDAPIRGTDLCASAVKLNWRFSVKCQRYGATYLILEWGFLSPQI